MRNNYCGKCRTKPACKRLCTIVAAELRDKGVYDTDPHTGELLPTKKRGKIPANLREIDVIYMDDPYNERNTRLENTR